MLVVKNPLVNAGDVRDAGLNPGSGRPPEGGNGNLLQYFCLENPINKEVWWTALHGLQRVRRVSVTEHARMQEQRTENLTD